MPTKIELSLIAAAAADPGHQWVAICQAMSAVVLPVKDDTGLFELIDEIKAKEQAAAVIANPTKMRGVSGRRYKRVVSLGI